MSHESIVEGGDDAIKDVEDEPTTEMGDESIKELKGRPPTEREDESTLEGVDVPRSANRPSSLAAESTAGNRE